jgi:hypothetical protein
MSLSKTPFPDDPDRHAIWEMLVPRDIRAFVKADWSMVAGDFVTSGFMGLHAHKTANPDNWTIGFPDLLSYKTEWLRQAQETAAMEFAEDLEAGIHRATRLEQIDFSGDMAMAHKKFDGTIRLTDGTVDTLNWQTLYLCRKEQAQWKIAGFVGYMFYR